MNHQRLRQLRLARGMTLSDLAQATNHIVTRQAISKYEHGQAKPSPTVLQHLAQALGVRPTDLLNDQEIGIELIAYRKRASLRKRQHDQIAALVDEVLRERLRLQRLFGDVPHLNVPLHHYPVADLADAETAANDLRIRWDLGSAPIANLTNVLEDHGLHVIALDTVDGFDGVAAVVRDEHHTSIAAAVIARRTTDGARWRMSLAHELGHLVLQPQGNLDEEKAAFRFAAALLAPTSDVRAFIGTRRHHLHLDELMLLKRHFGMSIQALLYRMLTLEIISRSLYQSLMIELSKRGWRTEEPEPLALEEPIWLRRAVLRALAEELINPTEAQRLLSDKAILPADRSALGHCQQLLQQPLTERHAILTAQAETARDLYQVTATPAREVVTSEYS